MSNDATPLIHVAVAGPSTTQQVLPVTGNTDIAGSIALSIVMFGSQEGTSPIQAQRIAALPDSDNQLPLSTFGLLGTASRNFLWNEQGANWDRVAGLNQGDNFPGVMLATGAALYGVDGSNAPKALSAGFAANMALNDPSKALMANPMGEWSVVDVQAASVTPVFPVATRAAVPGKRHILRSLSATLWSNGGSAPPVQVVVRDGASGVGTIIWAAILRGSTAVNATVVATGLSIVGTAGNAMTIEMQSAGLGALVATSATTLSMSGLTAS